MLPIRFRSVDRIGNDHCLSDSCRSCKFRIFYDSTNCWQKLQLTKKRGIINKIVLDKKSTDYYALHVLLYKKKSFKFSFLFQTLNNFFRKLN